MTSNNGSSLEHSSDGTAERAYPALLSSSPGIASDSTTDYLIQTLVPHEDTLERDLEQIMEENWGDIGPASSSPAAPAFPGSQHEVSSSGHHLGDTPVGPGLLISLPPGSGFMGPVQSYPQTFDMTREVVQRGRLDRPGSGRSSTPTGRGLPLFQSGTGIGPRPIRRRSVPTGTRQRIEAQGLDPLLRHHQWCQQLPPIGR